MNRFRALFASPWLWGVVALATLLACLTPWVFPGGAALLMVGELGVWQIGDAVAHPLVQLICAPWWARTPGALNAATAVAGALCVVCLCGIVRGLIELAVRNEPRSAPYRDAARAVAVPLAALALLASPIFLRAATHFQWQTFDLLFALADVTLIVWTARTGGHRRMAVTAFAIGLTAPEAPALVLLAPILLAVLGITYYMAHDRVRPRPFLTCLLLPALGGLLLTSLAAVALRYALGAEGSFKAVLLGFALPQILGVRAALAGPWLLMVLFCVVPGALAPFVIGATGANRRTFANVLTYLTMTVLAAITFLPLAVAPETLAREWGEIYPTMLVALVALGIGATGGAGVLLIAVRVPAEGVSERPFARAFGRRVAWCAIALAIIATVGFGGWGAVRALRADAAGADLPRAYVDAVLRGTEGGAWVLGDGPSDPYLALRVAETGAPVVVMSLNDNSARGRDRLRAEMEASDLFPAALKTPLNLALDIGVIPFVQDWLRADEQAVDRFRTLSLPDLFYTGNRFPLPDGLVYRGALSREAQHAALRPPATVSALLPEADAEIPDHAAAGIRNFAAYVRRQAGFVVNNIAFYLADADRKEEAYALFRDVYAYDPDNVSALFNVFELINGGLHPEARGWCEQAMRDLVQRLSGRRYRLWALARTYGYIRSPQLISALAGSWAMSGQTGAALSGMDLAMEMLGEEQTAAMQGAVAALYAMAPGKRDEAIARYKDLLARSTDTRQSLAYLRELIRMTILENDLAEAKKLIEQAESTGDPTDFAYERALYLASAGDPVQARIALQVYLDRYPKNIEALAMLATLQLQAREYDELGDQTRKRLVTAAGTEDNYFVQVIDAQLFERRGVEGEAKNREGNLRKARAAYLRALALKPEVQALRNTVLALDVRLNDKASAARHARDFLYQDRSHPLSNYVMGSIALGEGDLDRALAYLTVATAPEADPPIPEAFNDLAETHRRMGKWAAALAAAQRACELAPNLPVAHETAAAALLGLKRYGEAHAELDKAVALDKQSRPGQPIDPRFAITRARLHAAEGNPDLARVALAEARAQYDSLDAGAKAEFDALSAELGRR